MGHERVPADLFCAKFAVYVCMSSVLVDYIQVYRESAQEYHLAIRCKASSTKDQHHTRIAHNSMPAHRRKWQRCRLLRHTNCSIWGLPTAVTLFQLLSH